MTWSPDSWHGKPIKQQPTYRDENAVAAALARVRELPRWSHTGKSTHSGRV